MASDSILLRNKGDIVGFAKYVVMGETQKPSEVIHGHDLCQFARKGEHLVAIHGVQIFSEFEAQQYPYNYWGFEDPPVVLGDLNVVEKAFRHIIAWDNNKTVPNPQPHLTTLRATPKHVSADLINPLRKRIKPSPRKLRFSKRTEEFAMPDDDNNNAGVFKTPYRSALQELMNTGPKHDERSTSRGFRERSDESLDQFEFELDAENGELSPGREIADDIQPVYQAGSTSVQNRFEESDEFADEYDLEMENAGRSELDEVSQDSDVESNGAHENEGPSRVSKSISTPFIAQSDTQAHLSPAEKIIRRLNMRKPNRGQVTDESTSEKTSPLRARPSTRVRRGVQCNVGRDSGAEEPGESNQRINDRDSRFEGGSSVAELRFGEPSARRGRGTNSHRPVVTGSSPSSTQERQRSRRYSSVFLAHGIENVPPNPISVALPESAREL